MQAVNVISIRNICKDYRPGGNVVISALKQINIEVAPKEFVAIMGPSGSGKSTFMNILGCLDLPTSGQYFLNGEDVEKLYTDDLAKIRNKVLGFVFQGFNLLPRHTIASNVALPLVYSGISASERFKKAAEVLEKVGLEDKLNLLPNQLSGGQQQRVAIARAIVNSPKILLADEPTGNLDTGTSVEIMNIFQKLNQDLGIVVVLVTHEPDIAAFAQRLIKFKDGKVIYDGFVTKEEKQ